MQRIKQMLTEDDGVSPVIGVILMVAITVILAAVIASFVLGLGDTADEVQPNSNFAFDWDGDDLTITLTDGEAIDGDEIFLRGDGLDDPPEEPIGSSEVWDVGESISSNDGNGDFNIDSSGTVNVVWEESGGDSAATLGTFEIPE